MGMDKEALDYWRFGYHRFDPKPEQWRKLTEKVIEMAKEKGLNVSTFPKGLGSKPK